MQFVIGFLGTFFARLFSWVGRFLFAFFAPLVVPIVKGFAKLGSNLSVILVMFAVIGGFIAAFIATLTGLGSAVISFVPSEYVSVARMFIPDNLAFCISTVAAAKFFQIILLWKIKVVETLAAAK